MTLTDQQIAELRANEAANPSVAEICARLIDEANRLGLGHDGASDYVSQGGTRYINLGRRLNEHGDWNDDLRVRVGNHGGRLSCGPKEIHLTTLQSPAELAANIERALARMAELAGE